MGETRIVLDASAIVQLRLSAQNPFFCKSAKMQPRSYYEESKQKDEQEWGDKLRRWLYKKENEGWLVCSPYDCRQVAENAIANRIQELVRRVPRWERGRMFRGLLNRAHRSSLYYNTSDCVSFSPSDVASLLPMIKSSFTVWDSPTSRKCLKNRGKDSFQPEEEDYDRLAEAIVNKEGSSIDVFFVTSDGHFICHAQGIKDEYDIEVVDHRSHNINP